jgi:AcrR family transcriptional regulator
MPPKVKFNKNDIIEAAFNIAKDAGLEDLTARAIANELRSSVAPIYVNFDNLEDLKNEVVKKFFSMTESMIELQEADSFFERVGKASIFLAKTYSILYRELVIQPNQYMQFYESTEQELINQMSFDTQLHGWTKEQIRELYFKMKIFQTGLTVMIANDHVPSWVDINNLDGLLTETGKEFIKLVNKKE